MRLAGNVERMEEMENACRDTDDEREGMGPVKRYKIRWVGNNKIKCRL